MGRDDCRLARGEDTVGVLHQPSQYPQRLSEEQHAGTDHCRYNKKLLGRVKAFDRHNNMVLEGVKEM